MMRREGDDDKGRFAEVQALNSMQRFNRNTKITLGANFQRAEAMRFIVDYHLCHF